MMSDGSGAFSMHNFSPKNYPKLYGISLSSNKLLNSHALSYPSSSSKVINTLQGV